MTLGLAERLLTASQMSRAPASPFSGHSGRLHFAINISISLVFGAAEARGRPLPHEAGALIWSAILFGRYFGAQLARDTPVLAPPIGIGAPAGATHLGAT